MSTRDEHETREALADIEHVQAAFDRQQQQVDAMQRTLNEQRAPFDQEAVRLRKQLAAGIAAQHGNTIAAEKLGKSGQDKLAQAAVTPKQKNKTVTQSQYEKLASRIKPPQATLALKPPKGVVPRNVDHDLKQLAAIKTTLDGASNKLQNDFKQAHSPQRH